MGAPAHPVALDNVEVLEVDQWLALLIIGDLDPYTQPVTPPPSLPTRSAKSPNHKNRDREPVHNEPAGHGIGRSRGGLTTKVHHAVDGRGRPLAAVVTAGQCHDGQQLKAVLADIWVPREVGRPRTTPDALLADKAYSSAATRADLRARRIQAVIPERADQKANRKRKGSAGGRPPVTDFEKYKKRNVVERSFNLLKQWRALATRYDKHATIYRGAVVLAAIIVWLRS
ncbi:hypothetical protein KDY119_03385 [Luteimicrobium xylanilyticum]|uniref:Transposase IS4-like domain-containing protein n=1 Tax=Luteimicrobium xylanilyticum TaxID=1133546 RepID=A0A5P9QF02_9MICO|nr:hypothetical protein KDY119_03385 [Luteimicrobium xylanilyticum]